PFVAAPGDAPAAERCTTVSECLNDPTINPYKAAADPALDVFADCSKLALDLRAYFAIKTGRPFRYVSEIAGDPPPSLAPGTAPDLRYTQNNHPIAWSTAASAASPEALMARIA